MLDDADTTSMPFLERPFLTLDNSRKNKEMHEVSMPSPTPRLLEVAGVGGREEDAVGGGPPLLGDAGRPQPQVGRAGHAVEAEGGDGERGGPGLEWARSIHRHSGGSTITD